MKKTILAILLLSAIPGWAQFTNAKSIWSKPIDNSTLTDGYVLTYDSAHAKYVWAAAGGGTGTAPYSCAVSAVSSISCTHNLSTSTPWVACYDGSGNMLGSTGASTSITSVVATSGNVSTITFSGTTTATCVISSGSMGPAGATGPTGPTGASGSNGAGFNGRGTYAAMIASSPATNDTWEVTDASVTAGCSAGGGTAKSVCIYNGSTWVTTSVSGATVAATSGALKGDGAGNAVAVTGTATNCVKVDGSSGACGSVAAGSGISVSGSTVSFNPLDTAVDWAVDTFAIIGAQSSGNFGDRRWQSGGSTGTVAASGSHAGIQSVAATASANSIAYIADISGTASQSIPVGGGPFAVTGWTQKWIFKTPASATTDTKIRIGIFSAASASVVSADANDSAAAGNGVYLRYSNDGGADCTNHGADATWIAYAADGTNVVSAALGSIAASTWYTLTISSTVAGTVHFAITPDGGATTTADLLNTGGSPGTVTTGMGIPAAQTVTCTATGKTLAFDEYRWLQTGIAR